MTSEAKRQTDPKRGNMPDQDAWGMMQIPFYGLTYRALMKFAHRHNWHHAKVFGPFEDGRYQRWCQWCGLRESYSHDPRKPLEGPIKLIVREDDMTDGTKQVKQTDYEWYTDSSGITRRRSRYWHGFWGTFWGLFMCLNLLAILLLGATIVWAAFDIHERLPFALLAQIPALLMLAIRRIFR